MNKPVITKTRKHGDLMIVEAIREEPLAKILNQKEKEARIEILKRRYGVKLL